jgi:hypothetical protein
MSGKSSVVTGGHLSLDSFPSVRLPDGQNRVKRISYLAEVRNRLLRPLDPAFNVNQTDEAGFLSASTTSFDKILFLNDVYFSSLEALHLLFSTNMNSNGIAQYRTACAIDFVRGVTFYDSFIVRDTDGYGMGLMFYPWFAPAGSSTRRQDVRSGTDAVRVRSCWGGMAAFDAAVFQKIPPNPPHHPTRADNPIVALQKPSLSLPTTFRSSNETFWESGECCLLFADIEQTHGPPIPEAGTGVFINPFVRVAYTCTTWRWLPFYRRIEHVFEYLQLIVSLIGYPEHNPRRTHEPGTMVEEMVWTNFNESDRFDSVGIPAGAAGHFQLTQRVAQPGGFCGQRRLFVMKTDLEEANRGSTGKNWENIQVPLRVR